MVHMFVVATRVEECIMFFFAKYVKRCTSVFNGGMYKRAIMLFFAKRVRGSNIYLFCKAY